MRRSHPDNGSVGKEAEKNPVSVWERKTKIGQLEEGGTRYGRKERNTIEGAIKMKIRKAKAHGEKTGITGERDDEGQATVKETVGGTRVEQNGKETMQKRLASPMKFPGGGGGKKKGGGGGRGGEGGEGEIWGGGGGGGRGGGWGGGGGEKSARLGGEV